MSNSPSVQASESFPEKLLDETLDGTSDRPASDSEAATATEQLVSEVQEQTSIALLEERLRVNYQRRKIGEVVVRKTIETRIVEVPVRHEKLIIEQISPEAKQIAEVDLAGDLTPDPALELKGGTIVEGKFNSPRFASQVLYELGKTLPQQCRQVKIQIELEDPSLAQAYQERLNQLIAALNEPPTG